MPRSNAVTSDGRGTNSAERAGTAVLERGTCTTTTPPLLRAVPGSLVLGDAKAGEPAGACSRRVRGSDRGKIHSQTSQSPCEGQSRRSSGLPARVSEHVRTSLVTVRAGLVLHDLH